MDFDFIIVALFVIVYLFFGLRWAKQFVTQHWGNKFSPPNPVWPKYVLIGVFGLVFGYIGFAVIVIKFILKIVKWIVTGGNGSL